LAIWFADSTDDDEGTYEEFVNATSVATVAEGIDKSSLSSPLIALKLSSSYDSKIAAYLSDSHAYGRGIVGKAVEVF
jgi:hypothetical protein